MRKRLKEGKTNTHMEYGVHNYLPANWTLWRLTFRLQALAALHTYGKMPARKYHGVNGVHKTNLARIVLLLVVPAHLFKLGRRNAQVGQHSQVVLIAEPEASAKRGEQLLILGA